MFNSNTWKWEGEKKGKRARKLGLFGLSVLYQKWKIMRVFTLNLKMVFQRGKLGGGPVQQQGVLPRLPVLPQCRQF